MKRIEISSNVARWILADRPLHGEEEGKKWIGGVRALEFYVTTQRWRRMSGDRDREWWRRARTGMGAKICWKGLGNEGSKENREKRGGKIAKQTQYREHSYLRGTDNTTNTCRCQHFHCQTAAAAAIADYSGSYSYFSFSSPWGGGVERTAIGRGGNNTHENYRNKECHESIMYDHWNQPLTGFLMCAHTSLYVSVIFTLSSLGSTT